jgi:hypothetical protein
MPTFRQPPSQDSEAAFRLRARRDRLFGLWVAARLGLTGAAAEAYARRIMMSDMEDAGEERILHKVCADLDLHAAATDEEVLRRELHRFEDLARHQISRETQSRS